MHSEHEQLVAPFARLLLTLLLLCIPALCNAQSLLLTDLDGSPGIHTFIRHFEDSTQSISFREIRTPKYDSLFTPPPDSSFNFKRSSSSHWLRLTVNRQTNETWYLAINSIILSEHEIYIEPVTATNTLPKEPFYRKISNRLPTYQLNLPLNQEHRIYIRLNNNGKGILSSPILIMNANRFMTKTAFDYLFLGGMMIGILIIAIYNLFLFLRLRDYNYLALAFTQITITLTLQRLSNIFPLPFNISNPGSILFYTVFFAFMATACGLLRSLLNTKQNNPAADRWLQLLLILSLLVIPVLKYIPRADIFSFAVGCLVSITGLLLMIRKINKGNIIIRVFLIAVSIFWIGSLPIVAWGIGISIDFDTASRIFHAAALISSILMSLALAEKTRQMKVQTDEARAANKAKTEFLTTMSHELRTPMHAVVGVGSLLRLTALNPQQSNYVDKLNTSSQHMMSIIERVLDLSRLEKNYVSLEKKPFRIRDVIARVENLLSDLARQKDLALHIDNQYSDTHLLKGDPTRLAQVLLNLLGNAIKFTDQGHVSLAITPSKSSRTCQQQIDLTFEVTDTGIGLTPKQKEIIFKPFSQVDQSRTRKQGGFGLGLAISQKLVSNMGGTLSVDSQHGNGSCFYFTLNFSVLEGDEQRQFEANIQTTNQLNGIRILLIDDDEVNRFLGMELLQAAQAEVVVADGGIAALNLLQQQAFDLILIDISMPDMDGYETTRRIRAMESCKTLPVIALTAHAIAGERERCLNAGMNDYLTKPFETSDLLAMIRFWTNPSVT